MIQLINLQTSWNKPEVAEAFALLKKWGDQWLVKGFLGTTANDSTLLFTGGKVAQQLQGSWITDQIKGAGASLDDYGLFVPPVGNGQARMAGFAQQYMVSSKLSGKKLDALGDRTDEPALALVAGDALRLLGRESEALECEQGAGVAGGIAAGLDGGVVAAELAFVADAGGDPPDGGVVEEQSFDEGLGEARGGQLNR